MSRSDDPRLDDARDLARSGQLEAHEAILGLAGVPVPDGLRGYDVAFWRPGPHRPAGEPLFSATWTLPRGFEAPAFSVRRGDLKLMRRQARKGQRDTLYDLGTDPAERSELSDADRSRQLGAALDAWRTAMAAEAERRRAGTERAAEDDAAPDPAREEKLRELGYLD